MYEHEALSPWKRFWERGGWWKALLVVLVYYGLYQLAGLLISLPFHGVDIKPDSALGIVLGIGLSILVGSVLW